MKTAALVGLGNMGMGMAQNLLKAGFDVIGFDLRPERAQMLAEQGGTAAASLSDLAGADAVFIMVMTGAQVMDVVAGEGGLGHTLPPGATIIVTATIQPPRSARLKQRWRAPGST